MKSGQFNIIPVTQIYDKGCVLACLAMIRGVDQAVIVRDFHVDFNKQGLNLLVAADYLGDHGYKIVEKRVLYYTHPDDGKKFLLEPFADVHILCIKQFMDKATTHAVLMLKSGRLIDPSGNLIKVDDIYKVMIAIGIWK